MEEDMNEYWCESEFCFGNTISSIDLRCFFGSFGCWYWPSCPHVFPPKLYRWPPSVRHSVCVSPQDIATIFLLPRADTFTGYG